ncbi:MAG: GldG family protein [Oscillospiraceae bacterium]|nr:GldG family protein [Oscillospiraceae bacterium]
MNKRFKNASYSAVITTAAIAIVIIIALISDLLVARFPLSLDLTREGVFSLSAQTSEVLNNLEQDVTIYHLIRVADTAEEHVRMLDEILNNYERQSNRITVRQIDPHKNPDVIQRFSVPLRFGDFVITSGDRYRVVNGGTLAMMDQGTGVRALVAEQQLTNAIVRATDARDISVALTTGHGEPVELLEQGLGMILNQEGFEYSVVDLLTEDISDDVETIIIIGPQRDFHESEIVKLDEFLSRGNTGLVYLPAFINEYFANLDGFIAELGVTVNRDFVVETDSNRLAPHDTFGVLVIPDLYEHEITRNITGRFVTPMDNRSLTIRHDVSALISTVPLMQTSAQSYARANMDTTDFEAQPGDVSGPLTLASLTTIMNVPEVGEVSYSRVLIMGSNTWLVFMGSPLYANQDFFFASLNYLSGEEGGVTISPTIIMPNVLRLTGANINLITIISFVLPLLAILLGLFVFIRRRRL